MKANLPIVENHETFIVKLNTLISSFPTEKSYFHQLLDTLNQSVQNANTQALLQVEKLLWPAKINNLEIPVYIVSIQPQWAMDLFDPNMAVQTLFGADPSLMMNAENVYYCSSGMTLVAPARILWYVSKGNNKFQGTMTIRACSYLDEVVVDKPKVLFSRFKRLGVYTWNDVFGTAKQSPDNEIMAFRFSKTELFQSPIHRDDLQQLWQQTRGRNFNILRPIRISKDEFLRIYSAGMKA